MARLFKKTFIYLASKRKSSLSLVIAVVLWPTVTLGDVAISCNKEAFGSDAFWSLVKPFTAQINDSYVRVSLTKANVTAGIKDKKVSSAEVLAAMCAYYLLTEEKVPFISLHLSGDISAKDFVTMDNSLRGIAKARSDSRRGVVDVALNSAGGDVFAAMKIGRLLTSYSNTNTSIQPDALCASACVFVLAAGDHKSIVGKIGIHRLRFVDNTTPNLEKEKYRKAYDAAMQEVIDYLKQMGVRVSLADDMMRYSSDDIHFLDKKEIEHYGLDQRNPYLFEQHKAQQIARCGEEWYALKLQLDGIVLKQCAGFDYAEQYNICLDSLYGPLFKMCK